MTDETCPDSLGLSPEDIKALKAHRQQLDRDIETGRMRPGERRCVTLPNGSRFYLEHPDPGKDPEPRRAWWSVLAKSVKALLR